VKLGERNDAPIGGVDIQSQTGDVAKGREVDFWEPFAMVDDQRSSVACGGVGGVRKRVPPGHEVGIVVEADGGEDVFSASSCPRLGDDGAGLEDIGLIAELVNDVVVNLGREPLTGRHRYAGLVLVDGDVALALEMPPVKPNGVSTISRLPIPTQFDVTDKLD